MRSPVLIVLAAATLVACNTSTVPDFKRMTEQELMAYNASVPFEDQVFCETAAHTASRIPRRSCITVRDIMAGVTHIGRLETASSNTSVSQ